MRVALHFINAEILRSLLRTRHQYNIPVIISRVTHFNGELFMIKTEIVHDFDVLKNETIDELVTKFVNDFEYKIYTLIRDIGEHGLPMTIRMYDTFNILKGKRISYNNKNVEYEEVKTDLYTFFKNDLKTRESFDAEYNAVETELEFDARTWLLDKNEKNPKYQNWECLFGLGEFPHMIIKIVRIGNQKYSFYSITR